MNLQQALSHTTRDGLSIIMGRKRADTREVNPTKKDNTRRGATHSATRANVYRANSRSNAAASGKSKGGKVRCGAENRDNSYNEKLTYSQTMSILDARNCKVDRKEEDISLGEYKEVVGEKEAQAQGQAEKEVEDEYKKSVGACKVPIFGNLRVGQKHEEALRFFSMNVNGLPSWKKNNFKAERLKYILHKYKIDGMGLQEVCINWSNFPNSFTVASLLRSNVENCRSVDSHNKLEPNKSGNKQRGGTSTLLRDQLSTYVKKTGKDHTGLGRWSWYLIEGATNHFTLVVTAYAPCGDGNIKTTKSNLSTVAQQHQRYIRSHGLKSNPKQMFREDLISFLTYWRKTGTRIILMMDANEHTLDGCMCKMLMEGELEMEEVVA